MAEIIPDPKNTPVVDPPVSPTITEDKKTEDGENPEAPKTFTQADLDKIVSERLAREKAATDKRIEEEVKKATDEAARLANMKADEREKEVQRKKEEEMASKEKGLILRENTADAKIKFAELGLPLDLIDFVIDVNPETMGTKITSLKKSFDEAVQKGVESQLKGKTPSDPKGNLDQGKKDGKTAAIQPKNFL